MRFDGKRGRETGQDRTIDLAGMRDRRQTASTLMHRANAGNDKEMKDMLSRWSDIFNPRNPDMQTGGNDAPSMRSNHPEHVLVGQINAHMRENKATYGNTEINLQDLMQKETDRLTRR